MPGGGFDPSVANAARVANYLHGGTDNFEADRRLARQLAELAPPLREIMHASRAFTGRVVTWAARQGITQFLDLGAGLPASLPVHETARAVIPDARVAYVDTDPVAISHARALLARPGVAAVEADLTDPGAVLASPDLLAVIDPGRPVCVLLVLVLHLMDAGTAREVVAGYARLLAPGSVLACSVLRSDDEGLFAKVRDAYTPAALHNHSREDIVSFLGGLELAPPGLVVAHSWRGGMPDPGLRPSGPVYALAGAGRKR